MFYSLFLRMGAKFTFPFPVYVKVDRWYGMVKVQGSCHCGARHSSAETEAVLSGANSSMEVATSQTQKARYKRHFLPEWKANIHNPRSETLKNGDFEA